MLRVSMAVPFNLVSKCAGKAVLLQLVAQRALTDAEELHGLLA